VKPSIAHDEADDETETKGEQQQATLPLVAILGRLLDVGNHRPDEPAGDNAQALADDAVGDTKQGVPLRVVETRPFGDTCVINRLLAVRI
jgi:hypothetical protein